MTTIIHKGDVGTVFERTINDTDDDAIDVSGATTKNMYFKKPDGTKIKRTAAFKTDGTDGIIQYTSVADDIDHAGLWEYQGYVEIPSGKFFSEKESIEVKSTLYTAS